MIELRDRKRLVVLAVGIFFLFSLLVVQFYRIQIVEHDHWVEVAQRQHEGFVTIPFKRGTFWANTAIKKGHPPLKQPLAVDLPKFHLHLDPTSIPERAYEELLSHLPIERELLLTELARESRNRRLAMWLDREKKEAILSWWNPFARKEKIARNALFFVSDYQRSYPFGHLLGQVLHTIRDFKDETTKQGLPTGGLEAYFNETLKGSQGRRWMIRSPRHPLALGAVLKEAKNGHDIPLTINPTLQAIAEEELQKGVQKAQGKSGWAILMEPRTGEIWAFAQYPFFEPANYRDYFNDPELTPHTVVHAVTHAFEPGSVMKPITLAICLTANEELQRRGERPLFSPDEMVNVANGNFPGRSKPIRDTGHHKQLNMELALQRSSNIYMGRLVQRVIERLGPQWYREALSNLGFGRRTGIELPGETGGFLPSLGVHYRSGAPQWSTSTPWSLAIGYNLLVSSLQMTSVFAAFANGGILVKPTLVKAEQVEGKQVLSEATCAKLRRGMRFVTKPGGTARLADIPKYTQAGKTGTTEKITSGKYAGDVHFSTFVGFAPADEPEFVLLVAVDEPSHTPLPGYGALHFGGKCAAPIFREIARRSLDYLGTAQDDPHGKDWAAERDHLQEIYARWNDN